MATCSSCTTELTERAAFCVRCGTPAAPAQPARLVVELEPEPVHGPSPASPPPPAAPGPQPQSFVAPTVAAPPSGWPTTTPAPGPPPAHPAHPPPPPFGSLGSTKPDLRVPGTNPWPVAPLSVPATVLLAVVAYNVIADVVLANVGFLDLLNTTGTFVAAGLLSLLVAGGLVLLSSLRGGPPDLGLATACVLSTSGAAAVLSTFVSAVVVEDGPTNGVGSGDVFAGFPGALFWPADALFERFYDQSLLALDLGDTGGGMLSGTAMATVGLLFGLIGAGAGFATTTRPRFAACAGLGGLIGGVLGLLVTDLLFQLSPDLFYVADTTTPLVLLPVLVGGLGIGVGSTFASGGAPRPPSRTQHT